MFPINFSLIEFITTYGYIAILVGSFFEGETILVIGGLAVQQGYLHLPIVFLCSLVGTLASDNVFFFLGRLHGHRLVLKYNFFRKLHGVSGKMSEKSNNFLAFAMRFMYGFRHLVPFSLGMSQMPVKNFLFFNFLGGLTWVLSIGFVGYFFGDVLEVLIGKIKHYEFRALVIAIVVAVLGHTIYKLISRNLQKVVQK